MVAGASSGPAPAIARRLSVGARGADVKSLQVFLGVEGTGYYGALTRKAVQAFQEQYLIAKQGDQGYGDVGPLTRTILKGLSELLAPAAPKASTPPAVAVPPVTPPARSKADIEKELQAAQKRLEELLKQKGQ